MELTPKQIALVNAEGESKLSIPIDASELEEIKPEIVIREAQFPEEIPMHWNEKGEIDGYGSPATLFLFPFITLFTMAIVWLVPHIDPKKNVHQFQKTLDNIVLALSAFFFLVFMGTLLSGLGYKFDFANIIIYGMLVLFAVLGNYTRLALKGV